ncbi:MAG: CcoQ/FixQ family Cbb3-type cytochrome c oxidase assembly chaperone [Gammaproteobacteria bacterium CG22_combo_CG10-13_8_21_14_all_40_8]|nr:MAG: CcoQ/FixQ family Cbb3-type cytochrome c oxidase assembly chaperone [Gammaproteobacteria bacterium CG22_combo_CG10-13_8_21_14_all_40_8]
MDINTLRGIMTGLLIVVFIALFIWAYSKKRHDDFNEAALLPFTGDDLDNISTPKKMEKAQNNKFQGDKL